VGQGARGGGGLPMQAVLERYPHFRRARGLSVVLEPGDALYIPSLWWHEVVSEVLDDGDNEGGLDSGSGGVNTAVNFWYKAHSSALLKVYDALRWQLS
jgi:hypothetical protein